MSAAATPSASVSAFDEFDNYDSESAGHGSLAGFANVLLSNVLNDNDGIGLLGGHANPNGGGLLRAIPEPLHPPPTSHVVTPTAIKVEKEEEEGVFDLPDLLPPPLVANEVITGPVATHPYGGFYTSQYSTEAVAGDMASPGGDVIDYSGGNAAAATATASIKSYVNLYQPFEFDPFPVTTAAAGGTPPEAGDAADPAADLAAAVNLAVAASPCGSGEVTFRRAPASRTVSKSSDEGVCLSISEGKSRMNTLLTIANDELVKKSPMTRKRAVFRFVCCPNTIVNFAIT